MSATRHHLRYAHLRQKTNACVSPEPPPWSQVTFQQGPIQRTHAVNKKLYVMARVYI